MSAKVAINKTNVDRFNDIKLLPALYQTFKSNRILATLSFALILLINSVTPLSFTWLIYRFYSVIIKKHKTIHKYRVQDWFTLYSFIEVFWFFYQSYLFSKAQRKTTIPKLKFARIKELINHYGQSTLTDNPASHYPNPTIFFSKWAQNTDYSDISIINITNWFAFAFFGQNSNELNKTDLKQIQTIITNFSNEYNLKLNKHKPNNNTTFMKPFLYNIDIIKRPFIYYFVTDTILGNLGYAMLTYNWQMRFKFKKEGILTYWVYTPNSAMEKGEPIIFVHGIGAGIIMYVPFLMSLTHFGNRKIILINLECISMRYPSLVCEEIDSKSKTLRCIRAVLEREQIAMDRKCVFMGHSFGTVVLAWILNDRSDRFAVEKCIFIDPICFKLYEPDVTFNFVFRKPVNVPQLYLWYFICREFGIAYVIARHFWWFQNMIILNEKNAQFIKVFLSEKDCIVNSKSIVNYLQRNGVEYFVGEGHGHGTFLLNKIGWKQVRDWIGE